MLHVLLSLLVFLMSGASKLLSEAKTAVAKFENDQVTGVVTFEQVSLNRPVNIIVNVTGLGNKAGGYHVHSFPVHDSNTRFLLNSQTSGCAAGITGPHFNPLNVPGGAGNPTGEYQCSPNNPTACEAGDLSGRFGSLFGVNEISNNFTDAGNGLTLFGVDSIVGRSVVIHFADGARWVCATILEDVKYKKLIASFEGINDVSGFITLMQDKNDPTAETAIFVKVSSVDNSEGHMWHVHQTKINIPGACSSTGGHFNPRNAIGGAGNEESGAYNCTSQDGFVGCELGDLYGKHGAIDLHPNSANMMYFFTDPSLPLSGKESVESRSIVIHTANGGASRLSCGNILQPKSASAIFYNDGVLGSVSFTQLSPNSPVAIDVALDGLSSLAGGYHVHSFPVNGGGSGFNLNSALSGCSNSITGPHFNPLNVNGGAGNSIGTYNCSLLNQEGCEAGDLAGKFGSLSALNVFSATFEDRFSGLTLFGRNSIIGRSVVIHKDSDGSRWVCATIFEQNVEYKKLVASFDGLNNVFGSITLMQDRDAAKAQTIVFVNVWSAVESDEHQWHIHQTRMIRSEDCESTGGHFNPLKVIGGAGNIEAGSYNCTEKDDFAGCEIGDLYGKHGPINLGTKSNHPLYLFSDDNLPISGENSVSGRSIVLHFANSAAGRLSCANLGKSAAATFIQNQVQLHNVSGSVSFFQASDEEAVEILVNLSGLEKEAGGYHVHQLPVLTNCASTAGHFNPLNVVGGAGSTAPITEYACSSENPGGCEAGDISGRHGTLQQHDSIVSSYTDTRAGLTMFGKHSILGRALVIHKLDGTRWVCQNVEESIQKVYQTAEFKTGPFFGTIAIAQAKHDPDAESTVVVNLALADHVQKATKNHQWHVHELPLSSNGVDCFSSGGHFNPEHINGGANQPNHAYLCAVNGVSYCEVGDFAKKLGNFDLPNQDVYIDSKLPLTGINSISARSIVIHAENDGGSRISCANLTFPLVTSPTLAPTVTETPVGDSNPSSSKGVTVVLSLVIILLIGGFAYMVHLKNISSENVSCTKQKANLSSEEKTPLKEDKPL